MKRVLVLCTGNSCRSIMAEGLINALGTGRYEAVSAGSNPAGYVHHKSIETLKRHGMDVNNPRSKSWDEFAGQHFDLVITVCDAAAAESCPAFLGKHEKLHWSTPDPAKAIGTEDEINTAFDEAFAMLKERVERELLGDVSIHKISLVIDSCVWNKFYECNLDLSKELPAEHFDICMTKEVADFEVKALSEKKDKDGLYQYIESQMKQRKIEVDSYFGFASYANPSEYQYRSGGYGAGRFITYSEVDAIKKYEKEINETSSLRPNGLHQNEADASLATRSVTGFVVLTAESKKKNGALQKAYLGGGKVVFWEDFDSNKECLMNFIIGKSTQGVL